MENALLHDWADNLNGYGAKGWRERLNEPSNTSYVIEDQQRSELARELDRR